MSEPVSWHVYRRPGMSRRSAKPDGRIYGPEPWAVVRGVELSHWDLWFVVVMSSLSGGKRELVELLKSRRHDVEAKLSHLLDLESRLIAGGVSHADVLQGVTVDRALLRKAGDKVIEQSAWRPTQAMIDTPRKLLRDRAMRGHWPKFLVDPATCERAFDRFCRPEGDYGWRFTPLLAHTVERTSGPCGTRRRPRSGAGRARRSSRCATCRHVERAWPRGSGSLPPARPAPPLQARAPRCSGSGRRLSLAHAWPKKRKSGVARGG